MNCSQWWASPTCGHSHIHGAPAQTLSLVLWPSGPAASPPDLDLHMNFTTYADRELRSKSHNAYMADTASSSRNIVCQSVSAATCFAWTELLRDGDTSLSLSSWLWMVTSHWESPRCFLQLLWRAASPCVEAPSPAAFEFGCRTPALLPPFDNDNFFTYLRKWSCVAHKVQRESRRCNKTAAFHHQRLKD